MRNLIVIGLIIFTQFKINAQEASDYFGQERPGDEPQLFAPNIISSGSNDMDITISPNGNDIFFSRSGPDWYSTILHMQRKNNKWEGPMMMPFIETEDYNYPFISPNGKYLLFEAQKSTMKEQNASRNIFISEKNNGGWGEPVILDNGINTEYNEMFVSTTSNGNFYFSANYPESRGRFDIYMFSPSDKTISKAVPLR